MAALTLWLDSYNDIYSDFDNRNYLRRRISEDFLHELRMEFKYGENAASELLFILPKNARLEEAEKQITPSLSNLFNQRYLLQQATCKRKLNNALLFLFTGLFVILTNLWISHYRMAEVLATAIRVVLEPAGWFLLWFALDFLFYDYPLLKKERAFYRQLSKIQIRFLSA